MPHAGAPRKADDRHLRMRSPSAVARCRAIGSTHQRSNSFVRQHARPAVEDLHDVGAGLDLARPDSRTEASTSMIDQPLRTPPGRARRSAAPAPGPACPRRRPCRSPPSRARRRSRSAPSPAEAPPQHALTRLEDRRSGSSRWQARAAPDLRHRVMRLEPRALAFDERDTAAQAHPARRGCRRTGSPHRSRSGGSAAA